MCYDDDDDEDDDDLEKGFGSIIIGLDPFSNIWPHLDCASLCIDYSVERCEITVILFGSMLTNL